MSISDDLLWVVYQRARVAFLALPGHIGPVEKCKLANQIFEPLGIWLEPEAFDLVWLGDQEVVARFRYIMEEARALRALSV